MAVPVPAKRQDRESLRAAVVLADSGDNEPTVSVDQWHLVDRFESGGREYVVARRSDGSDRLPFTEREQEVFASAEGGLSNKEIAYKLGLSASTVRVVMSRICWKLGVRGRAAAIARRRKPA